MACTVCGCVCDDLRVTTEGGRVVSAEGACVLAEPWFRSQNADHPPAAEVAGRPVEPAVAYDRAAELLRAAKYPLIFGLSRSTTEGQRAATALADRLGATIDTTASTGHAPSIMALQQVGESTCTLGEIKNRADLVIYWGSDPVTTHPRHMERYALEPRGRWVPNGREDRFLVVVDEEETETAKQADLFIRIAPGKHWEALWELRMLVRRGAGEDGGGREVRTDEASGGRKSPGTFYPPGDLRPPLAPALKELARRMTTCRCGVVFFGTGLTRDRLAHRTIEALLQLVTDLNDHTRFYVRRMRRYGDVAGADSVLAWQTGYPFGVNLSRGYPRYNPGEFTGPEMLARGEPDLCLLVGSETAADFPAAAVAHLRRVPVITLDSPGVPPVVPAAVRFTTAVYGVHRVGTAYRMDEVPVPLRVLLPTDYPSDAEVLNELLARVV
ncbi:formylmethanofuran dehydrogenase subunit B [Gemmata sp.]|uniref:formylmethanofuran dehydrogenase subunit B n=1 Tax=Gemmata sp. TaxID=1914242 RepID=UPI003F6E69CD